jgi:hypothetical protein
MPRRNAKHFGGKAKAHFRRSRQIKIAGRNFYLESEYGMLTRSWCLKTAELLNGGPTMFFMETMANTESSGITRR